MLLFTNPRLAYNIYRPKCRWMSVRPPTKIPSSSTARKKVTIEALYELRQSKTPITVLTAYDYPSALACSSSHLIDITLVGDSLAQVCLGYASTTQLTLSEMLHHTRAVARGTTHPFLVADMPFGSFHASVDDAVSNAVKLVREGRAEAVKLEGGREIAPIVKRLTEVGIPVMAHIGLLPQRHSAMSGYKVQGRSAEGAKKVVTDALALEEAGAFALVVEALESEISNHIWYQVLVYDDAIGTWSGHKAKFVRRFANLKEVRDTGVHNYAEAVRARMFPDPETESYMADEGEWAQFMGKEKDGGDDVQ